jgi:hypothetical protein
MPLIASSNRGTHRPLRILLDDEMRRRVRNYTRYSGASADDIVRGALTRLFNDDVEFGPWEKANPEPPAQPSKKTRKAGESAGIRAA